MRFEGVSKHSNNESWLSDLSFELYPQELVALIGPADSGKTTLLRLILGLTQPDSGEIQVFGYEPGSVEALQKAGAVLDSMDFPPTLKVNEAIELVRAHFTNPAPVDDLAERCGFHSEMDRSISDLSPAGKRWLSIVLSLAGHPEAVFMDMPTMGMDVGWRRQFWNLVSGYVGEGCLACVSTDVLHEVETFATRTIILHRGRIVANGSIEEILDQYGGHRLSMQAETLPELDGIKDVEWRYGGPVFHAADSDTVVRELAKRDIAFKELEVRRPDLEEVLLSLIQDDDE